MAGGQVTKSEIKEATGYLVYIFSAAIVEQNRNETSRYLKSEEGEFSI